MGLESKGNIDYKSQKESESGSLVNGSDRCIQEEDVKSEERPKAHAHLQQNPEWERLSSFALWRADWGVTAHFGLLIF